MPSGEPFSRNRSNAPSFVSRSRHHLALASPRSVGRCLCSTAPENLLAGRPVEHGGTCACEDDRASGDAGGKPTSDGSDGPARHDTENPPASLDQLPQFPRDPKRSIDDWIRSQQGEDRSRTDLRVLPSAEAGRTDPAHQDGVGREEPAYRFSATWSGSLPIQRG